MLRVTKTFDQGVGQLNMMNQMRQTSIETDLDRVDDLTFTTMGGNLKSNG